MCIRIAWKALLQQPVRTTVEPGQHFGSRVRPFENVRRNEYL